MNNSTVSAYLTTNTIITVVGILFILFTGVYFYNQYRNAQKKLKGESESDNVPNDCPDYWDIVSRSNDKKGNLASITCRNTQKLGVCALDPNQDTFTFDDEIFTNPNTKDMARCKWSKQCQVAWDGYNNLCVP